MDPACLQAIYDIPSTPAKASPKNSLFVSGFSGEVANPADLQVSATHPLGGCIAITLHCAALNQAFLSAKRPDLKPGRAFSVIHMDGGKNIGKGTLEAVRPHSPKPDVSTHLYVTATLHRTSTCNTPSA